MSYNSNKKSEKIPQIETKSQNSLSLWDNSSEVDQENIDKVKRQWQRKQHQTFKRIRYQESQNKNIKTIVSSFVGVTLIALAFPHVANWWAIGQNVITESSSEEIVEDGSEKGRFLNKLNDLKQDKKGETNSEKLQKEKEKIGKKATMAEQLEESLDTIQKNRNDLKKAIELSDSK
ncbi:hypothetical protein GM3708_2746 [Geminocystis sp. NIES-3708]|uniref:hypothetical protein n=1 Tax=Geminocystis sp. NIES-3708 TaxID=1615909 RepID=UPI0005FCC3BD|nr:hypothetical protein [Geminocystis sp. NIES-3708]BAQ62340.1 hypothetical protein GM3708_2746 [Geminocystis sp. NIES-3708]